MAEEKKSDGKDAEALGIGAAAIAGVAILIHFIVPITLGLILSTLAYLSVSGLKSVQKIRELLIISVNYVVMTYLLVGLPWSTGSKDQFKGIFGDFGVQSVVGLVSDWNSYWASSNPFFSKIATVHHFTWMNVSGLAWDGLIAAVCFYVIFEGIKFFFKKAKKENPFDPKLNIEVYIPNYSEITFKVASFPIYPLLRLISFYPAAKGHEYAISYIEKNFWFLKKMICEGLLSFAFTLPYLFTTGSTNDFTLVLTGALTLPFFSLFGAFGIGLIPNVGDFINGFLFCSPYGHIDLALLNPFSKKQNNVQGFDLGITHSGSKYV